MHIRSMFHMYDETRTQSSPTPSAGNSVCEEESPDISPVTPGTISASSKRHPDVCLLHGGNDENDAPFKFTAINAQLFVQMSAQFVAKAFWISTLLMLIRVCFALNAI